MGNGNKVEFLVAVCALIASTMAVFIAWDQGRVMRAQQHGSVFPVLQVDGFARNNGEQTSLGIDVRNSGVGPALIESVDLFINDEKIESFGGYLASLPQGGELSWSAITGRALAPGETVTPIEIQWPVGTIEQSTLVRVGADTENWSLRICYCSVFEKCWQTSQIGRSRAKPVPACEATNSDIFEDLGRLNLSPPTQESAPQEASE